MAFIYKIKNSINEKVYIGKTEYGIQQRWQDHCANFKRGDTRNKNLHLAFKKYGLENFSVEEVEECSAQDAFEREKYWIKFYDSYKNGYNMTHGGEGQRRADYDLIIEEYNKVKSVTRVCENLKCGDKTVIKALKESGIEWDHTGQSARKRFSKPIEMLDKQGNYIKDWECIMDAARWIQSLEPEKKRQANSINSLISEVCKNKKGSAYGYKWRYRDSK